MFLFQYDTGEKFFTCSACDKIFASSNGLFYHERTNNGKTPVSCLKCDKSFKKSNFLKQHERTHK